MLLRFDRAFRAFCEEKTPKPKTEGSKREPIATSHTDADDVESVKGLLGTFGTKKVSRKAKTS